MHQTVTACDAIGNDIEGMYRLLNDEYSCLVYAEQRLNYHLPYIDKNEFYEAVVDPEVIVIYHFSEYWKSGQEMLNGVKGTIVFRYHWCNFETYIQSDGDSYNKLYRYEIQQKKQ